MDLNKLYQKIAPVLGSANCQCEVELDDRDTKEKIYHITYHVGRGKEPNLLLLKFSIVLDIRSLIEKLQTNHSLIIGEDTIMTFVKHKNIDIIPHLKQYNDRENNYDEIARVFSDGRGVILMDRFGV